MRKKKTSEFGFFVVVSAPTYISPAAAAKHTQPIALQQYYYTSQIMSTVYQAATAAAAALTRPAGCASTALFHAKESKPYFFLTAIFL